MTAVHGHLTLRRANISPKEETTMVPATDAHVPLPQDPEPRTCEPDDAPEQPPMDPKERQWWTARRETAYHALAEGAALPDVITEAAIAPRTLFNWRNHPYWQQRAARDREARAQVLEERLLGADAAALEALRTHLGRSAMTNLKYLQLRGLLGRPLAEAAPFFETLRAEQIEVLHAFREGRVTITPAQVPTEAQPAPLGVAHSPGPTEVRP